MFFKRRSGVELITIIILLVLLGATATDIEAGLPLIMSMIFAAIITPKSKIKGCLLVLLGAAAVGTENGLSLVMLMIFAAIITSKLKTKGYIGEKSKPKTKGEKIAERKGYIGEKIVERELKKLPEDYKILNNILIKNNDRSSQIDHIVVSNFGVFVIETKMYKGWIYGKEKQRRWVQNLYGKKYYFKNPLHQNYGHIQNLKEIKGLEDVEFISLILFSERATLKNEIRNVIHFSKVRRWISNYQEIIYTDKQIDFIYNTIANKNIKDKEARKEHVLKIKQKIKCK